MSAAQFAVSLDAPAVIDTTIQWRTADLTAISGINYDAASGTVVIPAGSQSATVEIQTIANCGIDPTPLQFALEVSVTGSGVTAARSLICTIDDPVTDAPALTARAVLPVPFQAPSPRLITWETADGSALAGVDYEDTEGGVLIPPGWAEVAAYIPVMPRGPGLPAKSLDVVFKWYDQTRPPTGYGVAQMGGWPFYSVARQSVAVSIADVPLTLDATDLPRGAYWATRDGTAVAGTHYLAASGVNTSGQITIAAAPFGRGQPRRYLYVDFSDATGLLATRVVRIVPQPLPRATAAPTSVAVTSTVLPACVPLISFDAPTTADNPDALPLSTMRCLASDWIVENMGSDRDATMTLSISSATCRLQIFGDYFPDAYSQPNDYLIEISGTAERITAVKTMFQAQPLSAGPGTIDMVLTAADGAVDRVSYAIVGVGSRMSWQNLPVAGQMLAVKKPSAGITPFSGILSVGNTDPFVTMVLTIEPDETGGQVMGPVSDAVSPTASGRGLVIQGNTSVLGALLIPLTIYVGDGLSPAPTAGAHGLSLTVTDGSNTINATYPYTISL
mgnify:CR=1 FL=1